MVDKVKQITSPCWANSSNHVKQLYQNHLWSIWTETVWVVCFMLHSVWSRPCAKRKCRNTTREHRGLILPAGISLNFGMDKESHPPFCEACIYPSMPYNLKVEVEVTKILLVLFFFETVDLRYNAHENDKRAHGLTQTVEVDLFSLL